jgi:two-component system LytT family response regulator
MDQSIISAIIIDDEPDAINLLEMYLRRFPSVKVVGTESDAPKGLELAKTTLPELIFLDIDMPDLNGLALAGKLQSESQYSEIVFTTAHQHYAYDALNIEPLDFLTKPFCVTDLETVIRKFYEKAEKKKHERKIDKFITEQTNSLTIKLPTTSGILFVDIKNIVFLRAKSNNCDIYLEDGSVETITRNLYKVANMLNSPMFFQPNRSTYINLNYLQRIDKKNFKCIVLYNRTLVEENISRGNLALFEKLVKVPFIED